MKILFVCSANRCRSPMAEGIAKEIGSKLHKDLSFCSAGTLGISGTPPTQKAIQVAKEDNIDISEQRSSAIAAYLLDEVDLILVMSNSHMEYIQEKFPRQASKCYLLTEYKSDSGGREIRDPVGRDLKFYRKIYNHLKKEITEILREIGE